MPRPRVALLATLAAGAVLFLVVSLVRGTPLAYTLGVASNGVAVKLTPGKAFCQEPIVAQSARKFDHVELTLGTYRRPGSPLAVTVVDPRNRQVLARGALAAGYPDIAQRPVQRVALDHAINPRTLAVCFRNTGEHSIAFYGAGDAATQPSSATRDGQSLGADVTIAFTGERHSWASSIGDAFSRARLFRTPLIPGWLYLVGLVLLAAGAAAALTAAVGSAFAAPRSDGDD
jgi:hypothetical protein